MREMEGYVQGAEVLLRSASRSDQLKKAALLLKDLDRYKGHLAGIVQAVAGDEDIRPWLDMSLRAAGRPFETVKDMKTSHGAERGLTLCGNCTPRAGKHSGDGDEEAEWTG